MTEFSFDSSHFYRGLLMSNSKLLALAWYMFFVWLFQEKDPWGLSGLCKKEKRSADSEADAYYGYGGYGYGYPGEPVLIHQFS